MKSLVGRCLGTDAFIILWASFGGSKFLKKLPPALRIDISFILSASRPQCSRDAGSNFAPTSHSFKKQARQGAPEPPSRRRSYLRRGSRRGATPYCAAYWMNILSPKEKNLYLSFTATLYAFITFLCPANALTSIIRVLSGKWKLVISPSIALKRYPG